MGGRAGGRGGTSANAAAGRVRSNARSTTALHALWPLNFCISCSWRQRGVCVRGRAFGSAGRVGVSAPAGGDRVGIEEGDGPELRVSGVRTADQKEGRGQQAHVTTAQQHHRPTRRRRRQQACGSGAPPRALLAGWHLLWMWRLRRPSHRHRCGKPRGDVVLEYLKNTVHSGGAMRPTDAGATSPRCPQGTPPLFGGIGASSVSPCAAGPARQRE